jgi:hypothetical protein
MDNANQSSMQLLVIRFPQEESRANIAAVVNPRNRFPITKPLCANDGDTIRIPVFQTLARIKRRFKPANHKPAN